MERAGQPSCKMSKTKLCLVGSSLHLHCETWCLTTCPYFFIRAYSEVFPKQHLLIAAGTREQY